MTPLEVERDRVVRQFGEWSGAQPPEEPAWLPELRRAAIERFAAAGFPTRRREDWKYTNAAPLAESISAPAARGPEPRELPADSIDAIRAAIAQVTAEPSLVFVDGEFVPGLSLGVVESTDRGGVVVDSLARALRRDPRIAAAWRERAAAEDDRAFADLCTAFAHDGAVVSIPAGVAAERPIHVVHVALASEGTRHVQNWIAIGESASATVAESYVAAREGAYLTNAVTAIRVDANAGLDHAVVELESGTARHVGTRTARVEAHGRLRSCLVSLGGELVRNETAVVLAAPGAECALDGLFVADGSRHVDNQTKIDHAAPHGTSRELYKGILDGRAHGIFNGTVIVRPDAQKTSAQQSNPNLLLSANAEIDTRPNLEIHADDVKCSHGSTVGQLDADALFFLRARAIDEAEARRMLCGAFAAEVIDRIPIEDLRDRIGRRVAASFGAAAEESA